MKILQATGLLIVLSLSVIFFPRQAYTHCQVPCGIYDDHARVVAMLEDVTTIHKAVDMLTQLVNKNDLQSRQQFTRWVMTKESHAQKIISTLADYFLTQRVKSDQEDYVERLKKHHAVIVAAMKAKQNATMVTVDALEESVKALLEYYPEK
ncbi:superoxide dismutase [Ni] [uncultured Pseudodesulfovibrio sp.]|uniref:superoxide dismutase [Ni] n=1 Tax=uncultured Pseudodesulfovibrio sp. TaxID=2035858 RepID=UPI0029C99527|nr:superoxide dismutase [Ni] [uncultured Pseudodesulfovibrio sp.]